MMLFCGRQCSLSRHNGYDSNIMCCEHFFPAQKAEWNARMCVRLKDFSYCSKTGR